MTVLAGDKSVYKPHLEPRSAPTARCGTEETWFPLRSVGQIDGGCAHTNVPSLQLPGAGTPPSAEIPTARENSSTNQEQNWFSSDLISQVLHGPAAQRQRDTQTPAQDQSASLMSAEEFRYKQDQIKPKSLGY